MSIQVFCHVFFFFFLIRLFVPVIFDCMCCFYILAISFLSVISFANIFSHSVVYLASLLRKSPETSLCPALGAGECVPACPQPSCQSRRSSSLTAGLVTPLQGSRTGMSSLLLMHASGQFPPVWLPCPPQGVRFLPHRFSSFPARGLVGLSYNLDCTGVFLPVCT